MARALRPDASGDRLVLGRRAVLEALRAGRPVSRVLVSGEASRGPLGAIVREARARHVPVDAVDRRRLDLLARDVRHQGVAAIAAERALASLDAILAGIRERGEPPFLIALDGVLDPQNLGAVIRTAEAAGAHAVIVPRRRAAGLGPAVVRASAGAAEHLPVCGVPNLVAALERLKREGVWVACADAGAPELYDTGSLVPPIVLVVGGEGRGLHRLVRERCDRVVRIPLWGRVESLNVSVAAALLLYEVAHRRDATSRTMSGTSP